MRITPYALFAVLLLTLAARPQAQGPGVPALNASIVRITLLVPLDQSQLFTCAAIAYGWNREPRFALSFAPAQLPSAPLNLNSIGGPIPLQPSPWTCIASSELTPGTLRVTLPGRRPLHVSIPLVPWARRNTAAMPQIARLVPLVPALSLR